MTGEYRELTAADLAYRWREKTVLESVDEAIAETRTAKSEAGYEYADTGTALRWLLGCAWFDLQMARHDACNRKWSIACVYQVDRIVGLTGLVGPVSWEEVPVDLIIDGIYERIHEAVGTPTPLTDDDRRRAQAVKDRREVPYVRQPRTH